MVWRHLYLPAALLCFGYACRGAFQEFSSLRYGRRDALSAATHVSPYAACIALILAIVLYQKHSYLRKMHVNGCLPAPVYPHKDPILGIDWIIDTAKHIKANTILEYWHEAFQKNSTYWAQNVGKWVIMTNEPENIKAVLTSNFESWPIGGVRQQMSVTVLGPHAIFSVNDEEWHDARAIIRPSFVRNQIADLDCTDRHVENMLRRLPRDGSSVDLQELFYKLTMDISTDFMFGYSTNMLTTPAAESLEFSQCFDYALSAAAGRGRLGWIGFLMPEKRMQYSIEYCGKFIDNYVSQALSQDKMKERPYVFMNEMVDSGADQQHIREQLIAMILGGRDTSASTLSSLFWILARRPDVVEKIRQEVAGLNGERPTWEDLKSMKYLNMVLKEVLRLWAPVSTNSRSAAHDTILPKGGGPNGQSPLFVPKGVMCRWSSYSLHRRRDVFGDDADDFRPERWESLRPGWEYIPFSGGPRICIGQQFALTQMSYLITRMFQEFATLEARDDRPMMQKTSTTISLVHGCWVSLTPAAKQ